MCTIKPFLALLFCTTLIAACNSDSPVSDNEEIAEQSADPAAEQPELLDIDWTLETVRGSDGMYLPLPLDATWRLNFLADGRVVGAALCNGGSGNWQANDATITIANWLQEEAFCEASERIPATTDALVNRLLTNEVVMWRIEQGRLFIDTDDSAQLVFSSRSIRNTERVVSIETLIQTGGGSRASSGNPVFGDLASPYVVYRDNESLSSDYAALPEETTPWPVLPTIDFTNSIVVGAYLPLDGSISSYIVVRGAKVTDTGLEIEVARFGTEVPDEAASNGCGAGAALSAPWTLVRVDSVVATIEFTEMARAFCSGIPAID